jgi:type 2 lantibiotic biosynthesis protein LanM
MRQQETGGFLDALNPFLTEGCDRLRDGVRAVVRTCADVPFDPDTVVELLYPLLVERLLPMLTPAMTLELHVARLQGLLQGATSTERFESYLERLRRHDVVLVLWQEYPVLFHQLLQQIDQWVASGLEFLARLCADWDLLRKRFGAAESPGPLTGVGSAGDRHRGGRSVLVASFSSGFQLVYKPRPLAVDAHFQELLTWLNERGAEPRFRTLQVLNRGTHGWVEFVTARGCTSVEEVRRFFLRQGGFLALLYALEATDFHFENLIAEAEHPVLIDLEALFHPRTEQRGPGSASEANLPDGSTLASSVLRVGLLPQRVWSLANPEGIDLSGLGASSGQVSPQPVPALEAAGTDGMRLVRKRRAIPDGRHLPTLDGKEISALDHAEEIMAGFSTVYRLLVEHREELLARDGPLSCFAHNEVRVILRPTQTYASLLRESFHPNLLRDPLDRDRFFDRLAATAQQRPDLARVVPAELDDLQRGDIPVFTTQPCMRHLWSSSGALLTDFFDEPGLVAAQQRLLQMGEFDLTRQLWLIRATLSTRGKRVGRTQPNPAETAPTADRDRLLAAARAIGDRLAAQAWPGDEGAAWLGLTALANQRQWALLPLGLSLYDGLPGVALFLAYLGELTGVERYTDLARGAIGTVRRQRSKSRETSGTLTSVGGFDGWGGIIYTYAHLAALWQEPALLREADAIVQTLPPLIAQDTQLDIIAGCAGCIGGLLTLYRCSPSPRILAAAIQSGDRLLTRCQVMERGIGWMTQVPASQPLTGFAHGAAGMAWALAELWALSGAERFRLAASEALAYERSQFSSTAVNWLDLRNRSALGLASEQSEQALVAWCHGAPGIGLARLHLLPYLGDDEMPAEIDAALRTTLARGFGDTGSIDNHSLCHGELGNLELLLQAGLTLAEPRWQTETARLARVILDSIERDGWLCGVPAWVENPGLLTGIAGIGYELLRLVEPQRVPSVLMLAPPLR